MTPADTVPIAALVLIGVVLIVNGLFRLRTLRYVQRRPWVPAELLDSGVGQIQENEVYIAVPYHVPFARYRYTIDGREYASERVCHDIHGNKFVTIDEATQVLDGIRADTRAYVDPDDPTDSVLVTRVSRRRQSHYYTLVVGGMVTITLAVALALLVEFTA